MRSEPTLITATINNLAHLVKTRPPLAQKVINAVIAYNPFSGISSRPITVHDHLMLRSIEKTIRVMMMNIMRYQFFPARHDPTDFFLAGAIPRVLSRTGYHSTLHALRRLKLNLMRASRESARHLQWTLPMPVNVKKWTELPPPRVRVLLRPRPLLRPRQCQITHWRACPRARPSLYTRECLRWPRIRR